MLQLNIKTILLLSSVLLVLGVYACGSSESLPDIDVNLEERLAEKAAENAALTTAKASPTVTSALSTPIPPTPTVTPIPPTPTITPTPPTPTVTPIPPTPTATHSPTPDPYMALSEVKKAMSNIDSYHADFEAVFFVYGKGLQLEMVFDLNYDYQRPDKGRLQTIFEFLGDKDETEVIRLGTNEYKRELPSGEWTTSINETDDIELFRPIWEDLRLFDKNEVQFVGFKNINGESVYHFVTDDPSAAAAILTGIFEFPAELVEGPTKLDLWVNAESHLIELISFENDEIDASILDFPAEALLKVSFDLDLSAFNAEVVPNIVAPEIAGLDSQAVGSIPTTVPVTTATVKPSTILVKPEPKNAIAYFNRGVEYMKNGQYTDAVDDFTKAIELDPDADSLYLRRAIAYKEIGKMEEAFADVSMAIELDPNNPGHFNFRGHIYQILDQHEKSIPDFDRAIELNPNVHIPYANRGAAYREIGLYEDSLSDLNKAIELHPTNASAYHHRGFTYAALNESALSQQDFEQSCKLDERFCE